jgi:hypothetical protein
MGKLKSAIGGGFAFLIISAMNAAAASVSVDVSPGRVSLGPDATQQFAAKVVGSTDDELVTVNRSGSAAAGFISLQAARPSSTGRDSASRTDRTGSSR